MRAHRGFTLLELLIVLVVIAILVTIAIPSLLGSRISANETAALGNVRAIVQAQMEFVGRKEADMNANGSGEYATFGELSGNVAIRASQGGTKKLDPNAINPSFRLISPLGEMSRQGYFYRIYLPDSAGAGLGEQPGGGADPNVDAEMAETFWCVYAWPQRYGTSGMHTYFANESGDIIVTDDSNYSGSGAPITPGAALQQPGPTSDITGPLASRTVGRDGNRWLPAGH